MGLQRRIKVQLLILLAILYFSTTMVSTTMASSTESLSVNISNAWYADGNSDGKQNDAFANVTFMIDSDRTWDYISYDITLTLPSGSSYTYHVSFYTNSDVVVTRNNFWNHATESGWYTVSIYASLNCGWIVHDSMTFDPPGGDNADPKSFSQD